MKEMPGYLIILLIGLDELPSWHDGGLPHFLPLGVSSFCFEPRPSMLPSVGHMGTPIDRV